jgi:hypothetical protein
VTHSAGDGNPLSLTTGKFSRPIVGAVQEPESLQKLFRSSEGSRVTETVGTNQGERNIFLSVEVGKKVSLLENKS